MPFHHNSAPKRKRATLVVRAMLIAGLSAALVTVVEAKEPTLKCTIEGAFNRTLSCVELTHRPLRAFAACAAGQSSGPAGLWDGWGRQLRMSCQGFQGEVVSAGPDGVFGTADDIGEDDMRQYQRSQIQVQTLHGSLPLEWTQ